VSIIDTPPVAVRGTGTVQDNWWAIYAGGRLVSIGVWLPPPVEGIDAVRLDEDEAAALLRTLAEQARG